MESKKVEVKSCADTAIVQHSTIKNEVPNENKNVEDTACDTNIQVVQKGNFGSGTNAIQVDDNYTATNLKQSQSKPRKSITVSVRYSNAEWRLLPYLETQRKMCYHVWI